MRQQGPCVPFVPDFGLGQMCSLIEELPKKANARIYVLRFPSVFGLETLGLNW